MSKLTLVQLHRHLNGAIEILRPSVTDFYAIEIIMVLLILKRANDQMVTQPRPDGANLVTIPKSVSKERKPKMHNAKKCPHCGIITQFDHCTCGGSPKPIRDYNLRTKLSVDVTLTLRFDHEHQPFILVQKPSGQERVALQAHDLIHV